MFPFLRAKLNILPQHSVAKKIIGVTNRKKISKMIKYDIVAFHNRTPHDHNFNKICIPKKIFFGRQ